MQRLLQEGRLGQGVQSLCPSAQGSVLLSMCTFWFGRNIWSQQEARLVMSSSADYLRFTFSLLGTRYREAHGRVEISSWAPYLFPLQADVLLKDSASCLILRISQTIGLLP